MREIILVLIGAVLMYIFLKLVSKSSSNSATWTEFKNLAATQQAANLIKTNEFRELVKTQQFKDVLKTMAEDQLISVSKTLVG